MAYVCRLETWVYGMTCFNADSAYKTELTYPEEMGAIPIFWASLATDEKQERRGHTGFGHSADDACWKTLEIQKSCQPDCGYDVWHGLVRQWSRRQERGQSVCFKPQLFQPRTGECLNNLRQQIQLVMDKSSTYYMNISDKALAYERTMSMWNTSATHKGLDILPHQHAHDDPVPMDVDRVQEGQGKWSSKC